MPSLTRPGKPTIHYEIDDYTDPWKHAPILMLQHGFSRSHRVWYSWVPYLSRFYKVVRADLRGLGLSARDFDLARGISLDAYCGDFNALIDELGEQRVAHFRRFEHRGIVIGAERLAHPLLLLAQKVVEFLLLDLVAADGRDRLHAIAGNVVVDAEKCERQRDQREDHLNDAFVLIDEVVHF